MEPLKLTRKAMADLLLSLKNHQRRPIEVLEKEWGREIISTNLPTVFSKVLKVKDETIGFSINEIVALGNLIEFTNFSSTAVQNWVKRDVKELIGPPQLGKKYTIEQAAMLLIVEDLKPSLNFHSISEILRLVFNNIADRSDDVIDPIDLYAAYATIIDHLHTLKDNLRIGKEIEDVIKNRAQQYVSQLVYLDKSQQKIIHHILIVITLSVFSAYYQSLTKKHLDQILVDGDI